MTFRDIEIPIVVEHNSLLVSNNELSLIIGEQGMVNISSGSGYYSIQSSDASVATATIDGNSVIVTAVGAGNANITVTDIKTEQKAIIEVKVEYYPLTLSASSLDLYIGEERVVNITSGNGNFTLLSSDANVATADMDGSSIIVSAIGTGTATITVTDTNSGQSVTFEVTVNAIPSNYPCPDDQHPHIIDLGLPSGTKWACCNVGANIPKGYGGYFAWGETEEKSNYDWSTYIHCDGSETNCHDLGNDISGTQYDVAHVKWGGEWLMPSSNQIKELADNCTAKWITIDDVNGGLFTGSNGNSIFMPAAGHRWDADGPDSFGSVVCSWSSTQYPSYSDNAYMLDFLSKLVLDYVGKFEGLSVRPVINSSSFIPLHISATSLNLYEGDREYVKITSGSGYYSVQCNDNNVAKVTIESSSVIVTAVGAGIAKITVTDTNSNQSAIIKVTVSERPYNPCPDNNHPHIIDLALPSGTKWACCNVGATIPEEFGGHYAWGETEEKDYYDNNTYIHYNGSTNSYYDIGNDIAGTQYDVAHMKWSGCWVMPSQEQIEELLDNCSSNWATLNGVNGQWFTGSNGGSIFLPAAGQIWDDCEDDYGNLGFYWSSKQNTLHSSWACYMDIGPRGVSWNDDAFRICGHSVRAVNPRLVLDASDAEIYVGESTTITINSGSGDYQASTSNNNIAIATVKEKTIILTGISAGSTTITILDTRSGESVNIMVSVIAYPESYLTCLDEHHPHLIDLGLPSGTKWACCNIDTSNPENQSPSNFGEYYAWGETEVKADFNWGSYIHCDGGDDTCHDLASNIAKTQFDVAHMKWGGVWVMPSYDQIKELYNNCTYKWTSMNNVNGGLFTGPSSGKIFLPAAGYYMNNELSDAGYGGWYWSASPNSTNSNVAHVLYFDSDGNSRQNWLRIFGINIRPVSR